MWSAVGRKGEFKRKLLDKLVHKVETPFKHKQGGFNTAVHGKESACVNLLTISAVNSVLSDKRRADKLSREAAKERMKNSRKRKRTPNTTCGEVGIVIREKLRQSNDEQAAEDKADKKNLWRKKSRTQQRHLPSGPNSKPSGGRWQLRVTLNGMTTVCGGSLSLGILLLRSGNVS